MVRRLGLCDASARVGGRRRWLFVTAWSTSSRNKHAAITAYNAPPIHSACKYECPRPHTGIEPCTTKKEKARKTIRGGRFPQSRLQERARQSSRRQMVSGRRVDLRHAHYFPPRPDVPMNVQNAVLAALTRLLDSSGIGPYHEERERRSRKLKVKGKGKGKAVELATQPVPVSSTITSKRKASDELVGPFKKRRLSRAAANVPQDVLPAPEDEASPAIASEAFKNPEPLVPPDFLSNITFGINEVTKRLEAQIQSYRHLRHPQSGPSTHAQSEDHKSKPAMRFIFACTQDVNPPSLIEHLPILVATCNASRPRSHVDSDIVLVPLPKNAEGNLTEAVKLRRTAVLALDVSSSSLIPRPSSFLNPFYDRPLPPVWMASSNSPPPCQCFSRPGSSRAIPAPQHRKQGHQHSSRRMSNNSAPQPPRTCAPRRNSAPRAARRQKLRVIVAAGPDAELGLAVRRRKQARGRQLPDAPHVSMMAHSRRFIYIYSIRSAWNLF